MPLSKPISLDHSKSRLDRRGLDVPTRLPLGVWSAVARVRVVGELAALGLRARSPAAPAELVELVHGRAVWRIAMPGKPDAFMSLRSGSIDGGLSVVMLDAARLYRAWLRSSLKVGPNDRAVAVRLKRDMPRDYKYHAAIDGFAIGRDNPVPLATMAVNPPGTGPRVAFLNGVTRTFWLLANNASAFPVEVFHAASAERLHQLAGIGAGPLLCRDLFAGPDFSR